MSSTMTIDDMTELKIRLKMTWESGDYGVFAKYLEPGALEFFERLDVAPRTRLLDVACGAGQLTLPAARHGVYVTALDLAANLVQKTQARVADEGLQVRVDEGDAEDLPYPDRSFDVVMSLIGAMFAPQPELVASEMIRVCRPGGRIVMGNWTPEGHVGQMFRAIARHVTPPREMPSPLLWGDAATCRQRLSAGVTDVKITRYMYPVKYPFGPADVVDFFFDYYGPANRAYASLGETAKAALHTDLTALWTRNNLGDDHTTCVESEYIEVVATRV